MCTKTTTGASSIIYNDTLKQCNHYRIGNALMFGQLCVRNRLKYALLATFLLTALLTPLVSCSPKSSPSSPASSSSTSHHTNSKYDHTKSTNHHKSYSSRSNSNITSTTTDINNNNQSNNISLPTIDGQYKTLQSILNSEQQVESQNDQPSETSSTASSLSNSCAAPEVLVNGAPSADIAGTVSGGDFSSISEIQFVGVVSSHNGDAASNDTLRQKRICKIKCLHGVWIGPLCALQNAEQFEPILRPCKAPMIANATVVQVSPVGLEHDSPDQSKTKEENTNPKETSEHEEAKEKEKQDEEEEDDSMDVSNRQLAHGTIIAVRCNEIGLYKLMGSDELHCVDGLWSQQIPSCAPTTIHQNFSLSSPPTILYTLIDGTLGVDERGRIAVLPGAILHLDCLFQKSFGQPHWTVADHSSTVASSNGQITFSESSSSHHHTSSSSSKHHSGTNEGNSHSKTKQQNGKSSSRTHTTGWAILTEEHSWKYRLAIYYANAGDSGRYTCHTPNGLHNSIDIVVKEVECAPIDTLTSSKPDPNRVKSVEGGPVHRMHDRIRFSCLTGYQLVGPSEIRCKPNGKWSHSIPTCKEILCPDIDRIQLDPKLLISGLSELGQAAEQTAASAPAAESIGSKRQKAKAGATHGAVITFRCPLGYRLLGASTVQCTRNSRWSHPFPSCEQITCPEPKAPVNGHIEEATGHYLIGDYVQYGCNSGHIMVGQQVVTCLQDGTWSYPQPTCKTVCEFPSQLENGYLQPAKFYYDLGEQVQVHCDAGFALTRQQQPTTDKNNEQQQQLPNNDNANSVARTIVVNCDRNGQWSEPMPKCTKSL